MREKVMEKSLCTTRTFHFGSQSEGTTTLEMNSDIDSMFCHKQPAILTLQDWTPDVNNYLVIKNETSPPQHCSLQIFRFDIPEPFNALILHDTAVDKEGRVLLQNTYFDSTSREQFDQTGINFVKHGPAVNDASNERFDYVHAFHCAKLPNECLYLESRPKAGRWPSEEILLKAQECGTFVVPVGYPESENSKEEWRFSTSLFERLLMFELNVIQLKTYVMLKLMKSAIFKPFVGNQFSSYHCKTALFYTIEENPADIWREDNLFECLICCLRTILRWLQHGYCPHFTIKGVNLFVGKLSFPDIVKLKQKISEILSDNLRCLLAIQTDCFGERLRALAAGDSLLKSVKFTSGHKVHCKIAGKLVTGPCKQLAFSIARYLSDINTKETEFYGAVKNIISAIQFLDGQVRDVNPVKSTSATYFIKYLCSTLASLLAAKCVKKGLPLTTEVVRLFEVSMDIDLCTNRLKLASCCYCKGRYQLTADILQSVERDFSKTVVQICGCLRDDKHPPNGFNKQTLELKFDKLTRKISFCVRFLRHERDITPGYLLCEMYRTQTETDVRQRSFRNDWMDMTVVDGLPLLYYLQYLTFSKLEQRQLQITAFENLKIYVQEYNGSGHLETAINLLGHVWEIEGRPDKAYEGYMISKEACPSNNAAQHHISRLQKAYPNGIIRIIYM